MLSSDNDLTLGAVRGYQSKILGTLAIVGGTPATSDVQGTQSAAGAVPANLPLAGQTLGAGTYYFFLAAGGAVAVDVTLRCSAGNTNIDTTNSKVYRVISDYVTEKMNAAGASAAVLFSAFTNGTQQTVSVTGLRGERGVLLKLVLTGAVTFDQADYSAA